MESKPTQEEFFVNGSRTPVLRAGYSNSLLIILAIALGLCNQAMIDGGAAAWVRGIALVGLSLVGLYVYACSLSRIYVRNGQELVLVGPLTEDSIELREIAAYEVWGIQASQFVCLKLRLRSSSRPRFRFVVAVSTSAGGYAETKAHLRTLMEGVLHAA